MTIKKHIFQDNYLSWTQHFSLFTSLTPSENEIFRTSPQAFQQKFPDVRLFPDPLLKAAHRESSDAILKDAIIVTGEANRYIAEQLKTGVQEKYDICIDIIADTTDISSLYAETPIILIGGVQDNRWSRRLAQRLQLGAFNDDLPGKSGWGITTYQGIEQGLGIRYVLAGAEAVDYFLKHAINEGAAKLQWVHHVHIDPNLPAEFHDFDLWLQQLPQQTTTKLSALKEWINSDHQLPYRDVFPKVLLSMKESPIIANSALLDIGIEAIRYYQLTGNERGLDLFREMMWGFWEYFNCDDPNIYISDMDFRLGQICNYWSWIEHHPTITDEERRKFAQLLLGAMRMVYSYYRRSWAQREMPEGVSHNHQTFKGRCLLWGWRYFRQFDVADSEDWKRDADAIFERIDASRTKFTENANGYETFVPEHLLTWYEVTDKSLSEDFQRALAVFAQREWALTDNFCYRVEYGDCDVTFRKKKPFQVAPWLSPENSLFDGIRSLEQYASATFPPTIPRAISSFGDIQIEPAKNDDSDLMTGWTRIPLEPKLEIQYPLQGEEEQRFDKLAWKSGWQNSSAYVAIEGIGNTTVSHAHNAVNSILRANLGERVWLVQNGYGKRIGVDDAGEAWSTRETGPVDHNMLILRDAEDNIIMPPVNALLVDSGDSPIPFVVTELPNYGGYKWIRHVFVLQESGLIFIDSFLPETAKSTFPNASLEWNILGAVDKNEQGAVIDQSGVKLVFRHFDTGKIEWDYNASASWHRVMANHEYPYTTNAVEKCILKLETGNAVTQHIVSGFWLEDEVQEAAWNNETQLLQIHLRQSISTVSAHHQGSWGQIKVDGNGLQIMLT